jgi:2-amino-4-hydroxy-6-hydroxymethyldihydropteridine diphosphokinase
VRYWIGLGSNLGDRLGTLRKAAEKLAAHGTVLARSRIFASSAVGGPPQPSFLNAAVLLDSDLPPLELLRACQRVELELGRVRASETVRWGPRTLDVDLLMAGTRGEQLIALPDLDVPHVRLHERAFALAPLVDMDATLMHPKEQRSLKALLTASHSRGHALAPTGDTL